MCRSILRTSRLISFGSARGSGTREASWALARASLQICIPHQHASFLMGIDPTDFARGALTINRLPFQVLGPGCLSPGGWFEIVQRGSHVVALLF